MLVTIPHSMAHDLQSNFQNQLPSPVPARYFGQSSYLRRETPSFRAGRDSASAAADPALASSVSVGCYLTWFCATM
jgi:hypothetical protein